MHHAASGSPVGSATPAATAESCALPVTRDGYDGFHIGVPDGWSLFTLHGTIVVTKDAALTEESTLTPGYCSDGPPYSSPARRRNRSKSLAIASPLASGRSVSASRSSSERT